MKNKLNLEFAHKLLHDALTARVKNTNRAFYWLVRNKRDEWKLFREEPEYNPSTGVYKSKTGTAVFVLREANRLADNVIPVKINLADYRPCKLGTMKIAHGQEIPTVQGGGNVYNFIEEVNDLIYNWYVDNDVDRPSTDSTHDFDVDAQLEGASNEAPEALQEPTSESGTGGASEVDAVEEDPFGPLYERSPAQRVNQWANASKLKDLPPGAGVTLHETMTSEAPAKREPSIFEKANEKCRREDPIKYSLHSESLLESYITQSCVSLLDDNVFDEELPFLMNIIKMLPKKFVHVRRLENGAWCAGTLSMEFPTIIYHNPASLLCPAGEPTMAYKLSDEMVRAKYRSSNA